MSENSSSIQFDDREKSTRHQAVGDGISVLGVTRTLQLLTALGAAVILAGKGTAPAYVFAAAAVTAFAAIGGIVALELGRRRGQIGGPHFLSPHTDWDASIHELNSSFAKAGTVVNNTYREWVKNRLHILAGEFGALGKRELHAEGRNANRVIEDLFRTCTCAYGLVTPEIADSHLRNWSTRFNNILAKKSEEAKAPGSIKMLVIHRREDDAATIARVCTEWAKLGVVVHTLNIDESRSVEPFVGNGDSLWLLDQDRPGREVVFELFNQSNGYLAVKAYFERNDKTMAVTHFWNSYSEHSTPFTLNDSGDKPAATAPRLAS